MWMTPIIMPLIMIPIDNIDGDDMNNEDRSLKASSVERLPSSTDTLLQIRKMGAKERARRPAASLNETATNKQQGNPSQTAGASTSDDLKQKANAVGGPTNAKSDAATVTPTSDDEESHGKGSTSEKEEEKSPDEKQEQNTRPEGPGLMDEFHDQVDYAEQPGLMDEFHVQVDYSGFFFGGLLGYTSACGDTYTVIASDDEDE